MKFLVTMSRHNVTASMGHMVIICACQLALSSFIHLILGKLVFLEQMADQHIRFSSSE
jgi:hypothetical protein